MPSFFDRMRENREQREREREEQRKQREYQRRQREYETALSAWNEQNDTVENLLEIATHRDDLDRVFDQEEFTVRLKRGEQLILHASGAALIEPRSTGGHWEGGSQGVSFRIAKGVRYRVGQTKGTFVRNPEEQKIIDSGGDLDITTQRVMYTSPARTREWDYAKTMNVMHDPQGITYMSVSSRQKTSGFMYGPEAATRVEGSLTLGMAIYDDEVDTLVEQLQEQIRELQSSKPTPPALPQ